MAQSNELTFCLNISPSRTVIKCERRTVNGEHNRAAWGNNLYIVLNNNCVICCSSERWGVWLVQLWPCL